ncbi:hypothetical protein KR51_00035260 [Rubidibacter lacunae KORDI 51-2]|uniref:Uncharacterized protein n=1 Tax=Rubidibacter lacunae KORDI 51-2 TaxID=582515 RepID=U5D5V4_9CHRO|nr:hypothetical protein [Rubidibacter lacunae]ERN40038.1 hypothetical protein KR51_00035260 [Rubidibacter lacunae KORDI 51-2]
MVWLVIACNLVVVLVNAYVAAALWRSRRTCARLADTLEELELTLPVWLVDTAAALAFGHDCLADARNRSRQLGRLLQGGQLLLRLLEQAHSN